MGGRINPFGGLVRWDFPCISNFDPILQMEGGETVRENCRGEIHSKDSSDSKLVLLLDFIHSLSKDNRMNIIQ